MTCDSSADLMQNDLRDVDNFRDNFLSLRWFSWQCNKVIWFLWNSVIQFVWWLPVRGNFRFDVDDLHNFFVTWVIQFDGSASRWFLWQGTRWYNFMAQLHADFFGALDKVIRFDSKYQSRVIRFGRSLKQWDLIWQFSWRQDLMQTRSEYWTILSG